MEVIPPPELAIPQEELLVVLAPFNDRHPFFELGVLVVVGALAGSWLDEQLGTSPLFLMLLSLTALVGGMIRVHRTLQRLDAENEHNPPHS